MDSRDKKAYPTIQVNNQCWMAKNLNVGTRVDIITGDGGAGPNSYNFDEANIQKWCQANSETNCTNYGGLYEWWEVVCGGYCDGKMTPAKAQSTTLNSESQLAAYGAKMVSGTNMVQGICLDGWHLPSDAEWTTLGIVKAGWTIQLGGYRIYNGDSFYSLGAWGGWWSSTPFSSGAACTRYLLYSANVGTSFGRTTDHLRSYGFSVRCIRN